MHYFSPATRDWFERAFAAPTEVQGEGWPRIADGENTLLIAPTGSGKTLAAFLYALDRLGRLDDDVEPGVRVVYVSPLKALVYDIERNLRAPLAGLRRAAEARGDTLARVPRVAVRTGERHAARMLVVGSTRWAQDSRSAAAARNRCLAGGYSTDHRAREMLRMMQVL